jgi:hypothetical protein
MDLTLTPDHKKPTFVEKLGGKHLERNLEKALGSSLVTQPWDQVWDPTLVPNLGKKNLVTQPW